jgi:hypothetical protein
MIVVLAPNRAGRENVFAVFKAPVETAIAEGTGENAGDTFTLSARGLHVEVDFG